MGRLLIFLALSSVAAAGTIEDGIPDARYREYGETFSEYTLLLAGTNDEGNRQYGSCVVISPRWALTAAHVAKGLKGGSIVADDGGHAVDRIEVPADYTGEFAVGDIALVRVSRAFTLKTYAPLTDGTERLGTVVAAAGYGVTGRLSSGYVTGDNQIRAGTMRLSAKERSVYVCEIRRCCSPLPYCIAPGDSGGPLWGKASDGRTVLIGINSYTARAGKAAVRSRAGEESGHTRVAEYLAWIREVAELDDEATLAKAE